MIRYDYKLQRDLTRAVSNFNRKVSRLERLDHQVVPDRVYVSEIKSQFTNRQKLKSYIKTLQRFSQRGAEKIVETKAGKTTDWALNVLKQQRAVAKSRITREIKRISSMDVKHVGRRYNYILNLQARYNKLSTPLVELSPAELKTVETIIKDTEPDPAQDENFYKEFFGWLDEARKIYPSDLINEIESILRQLSPQDLADAYRFERCLQDVKDLYFDLKSNRIDFDEGYDRLQTLKLEAPRIVREYGGKTA